MCACRVAGTGRVTQSPLLPVLSQAQGETLIQAPPETLPFFPSELRAGYSQPLPDRCAW